MKIELEQVTPAQIEHRSFEIIESELPHPLDPALAPIIKRVIHTTADFDYADSLCFSPGAVDKALAAIQRGACIVTDTNMGRAGINKNALARHGGEALCFMADEDVAAAAKANGTTRAVASMDKAAALDRPLIFAVGNAPTALLTVMDLIAEGRFAPDLVIGVPVGFVNAAESKELLAEKDFPYITVLGRKGGTPAAVAAVNALLRLAGED